MKKSLLLLVLLLISTRVFAQTASGEQDRWKSGSVYSYFGLGSQNHFYSAQAAGMGLEGVAVFNVMSSNTSNPALWGYPVYTTGMGSFHVTAFDANDPAGRSKYTSAGIGNIQLLLPVERNRLGLSASLVPYTSVSYRLSTANVIPAGQFESGRDVQYETVQAGTGGLNKLEFGLGYSINKNISVGIAPALAFGIIDRNSETVFDTLIYQNVSYRNREIMNGFAMRAGLFANKNSILKTGDNLAIGITYDLPTKLNVKERLYTRYTSDEIELPARRDSETTVPWKTTVGIAYRPVNQVLISAEGSYQPWSEYAGNNAINTVSYADQVRLGLGSEFQLKKRGSGGIFNHLLYRVGLSNDTGYLKFEDQSISTWLVHAGIGIPSQYTGSLIDVNFSYGQRGAGSGDFVKEKIFLTRVSFNLTELMFLKRRLQ